MRNSSETEVVIIASSLIFENQIEPSLILRPVSEARLPQISIKKSMLVDIFHRPGTMMYPRKRRCNACSNHVDF